MPTWLLIVIAVLVVLIVLLAIGGYVAVHRRQREQEDAFRAAVDEANRGLAAAHAEDKGWEPNALREAARRLFEEQHHGTAVRDMQLVAVEDRPGIEEDRAVFRFETEDGGAHHLTVGRTPDGWALESLS
ncbi:MAG: hypothetical protein QOE63_345 [Acidimicrobiaceae bacterium]